MIKKSNDLTNKVFNRLTVFKKSKERASDGSFIWLCSCSCGSKTIVKAVSSELKRGGTTSCGCLRKEKMSKIHTTHGASASKANNGKPSQNYELWSRIKDRCYNSQSKDYKDYGNRGIKMFKDWIEDFSSFQSYITSLPNYSNKRISGSNRITIDRINNNKGYVPGNLKWSTWTEQNRNKRDNLWVFYKGKERLFIEVVEKYSKTSYKTVYERYYVHGWSLNEALTTRKVIKKFKYKAPGQSI